MEELIKETVRVLIGAGEKGWLIAILEGFAIVYLYKSCQGCATARIDDVKEITKTIEESTQAHRAMTVSLEADRKAVEARTQAAEQLATEIRAFKTDLLVDVKVLSEKVGTGGRQ